MKKTAENKQNQRDGHKDLSVDLDPLQNTLADRPGNNAGSYDELRCISPS